MWGGVRKNLRRGVTPYDTSSQNSTLPVPDVLIFELVPVMLQFKLALGIAN